MKYILAWATFLVYKCLGPDTWGNCYSTCNGQSQSPIDLPRIPKTYQAHISKDPNAYLMLNLLTYPAIEYSPKYFTKSLTGELSNTGLSGNYKFQDFSMLDWVALI